MKRYPRSSQRDAVIAVHRQSPGKRALGFIVGAVLIGVIFGGPGVRPARAAQPEFLRQFGENCGIQSKVEAGECGAPGETAFPRGLATDENTGHLFVGDQQNRRVDEFTAWGEFVKAFGWDVAPGTVNEQQELRVRAASGTYTLSFGGDTTAELDFDAPAKVGEEKPGGPESVEAALNALPSISSAGSLSVEGSPGNPNGSTPYIYLIAFTGGSLTGKNVAQISAANGITPLTGGSPATELEVGTRADGHPADTGLESCTTESGCKGGAAGVGAGQFGSPQGVATDAAGDIYVVDVPNLRVEKFDPAGRFLWMVGGGVDQGPNHAGNLCTATFIEEEDTCGDGSAGAGDGQFSAKWPFSSYVAVASTGVLYVGDENRIQEFEPDGSFRGQIDIAGRVSSLAVIGARLFVAFFDESHQEPFPNVHEFATTGAQICEIPVGQPTALAADPSGGVYVAARRRLEDPSNSANEIRHYDAGCAAAEVGFAREEFEISTGLATNGAGDLYISSLNDGGANSFIRAYGPPPISYESPPLLPPLISAQYATVVGTGVASVQAQINPRFWPDATYRIQYGTAPCFEGGCLETIATALTPKSVNTVVKTDAVQLSDLRPDTTYYYRFIAESSGGGPVFGLDGKADAEAEGTFHTYRAQSATLPDERAYELVSPPFKDGGEVGVPPQAGGAADFSVQPQQASPSGDGITYHSFTAFGEHLASAPATSQYVSHLLDVPRWETENPNPLFEEGYTRDPYVAFSDDLSHAALIVIEPPLTPAATVGFPNLYVRDNVTGTLSTVTTKNYRPEIAGARHEYCLYFGGASTDYGHVYFGAKGALQPGDPVANNFNLYEWTAASGVKLASVLPNGTAATPNENTTFGRLGALLLNCQPKESLMRHAVSGDGSTAFWTYQGTYEGAKDPLFARLGGHQTIEVDARQGLSGVGGEGVYGDASVDGSRVFFTDTRKLTTEPTTAGSNDLYRYDFTKPVGSRLANLTAHTGEKADVSGVIGASASGSYVYFVASGILSSIPNGRGESAQSGGDNLYAWHEGAGIRFLGRLAPADQSDWEWKPDLQTARLTPDGRQLAFLSTRSLTGFDNSDQQTGKPDAEAFLYSYEDDLLSCASCNPSGARPAGPARLPVWATPYQQPRYLSDDGSRLFFETFDSLSPQDDNGKMDVYEFEVAGSGSCNTGDSSYSPAALGCIFLISSGHGGDQSYVLDASANGDAIFFSTRDPLDPYRDKDESHDVYVARVGGTAPHPEPEPCQGHCPSSGSPEEAGPPLSSSTSSGLPNRRRRHSCPRGKVRRHGHCVKRKQKPRRGRHNHNHSQKVAKFGRVGR